MRPLRFWTFFLLGAVAGDLGSCRIATGDVPAPPAPIVKTGAPSQVLVRIGRAYKAEYRKPKPHRKRH